MCGIAGVSFVTSEDLAHDQAKLEAVSKAAFHSLSLRGRTSYGMFTRFEGTGSSPYSFLKELGDPLLCSGVSFGDDWDTAVASMIFHTRAPSVGASTLGNCQPCIQVQDGDAFALAHNGTIGDHDDFLRRVFGSDLPPLAKRHSSDSHALATVLRVGAFSETRAISADGLESYPAGFFLGRAFRLLSLLDPDNWDSAAVIYSPPRLADRSTLYAARVSGSPLCLAYLKSGSVVEALVSASDVRTLDLMGKACGRKVEHLGALTDGDVVRMRAGALEAEWMLDLPERAPLPDNAYSTIGSGVSHSPYWKGRDYGYGSGYGKEIKAWDWDLPDKDSSEWSDLDDPYSYDFSGGCS